MYKEGYVYYINVRGLPDLPIAIKEREYILKVL